jgi:hypothetical protein
MSHNPEVVQVWVTPTPNVVVTTATFNDSNGANVAYHHVQGASSTQWDIPHGLGFFPNVTVMDSGGSTAEGELAHTSKYRLRVTFSSPISGNAYLS